MKFMRWLHEKLSGATPRDIPNEAISAVDENIVSVRSLRKQLDPFRMEDDPFAAIIRKQIMTADYELAQMDSIHRGPLP